jgi:uncharacterized phage protein (TIGR01671 family)
MWHQQEGQWWFIGDEGYWALNTDFGEILCDSLESAEFNLMQFTGLHDKHGVEIYEGDVVRLINEDGDTIGQGVMFWNEEKAEFLHSWEEWLDGAPSGFHRPPKKLWLSRDPKIVLEVIGNVHERSAP